MIRATKSTHRHRTSAAFLLARCGLTTFVAATALMVASPVLAQDTPKDEPNQKAAEEAKMKEDAARRFKEQAEKEGFKDANPAGKPAPAPAPAAKPAQPPAVTPPKTAPSTINQPQPKGQPQPNPNPNVRPGGAPGFNPGAAPGATPPGIPVVTLDTSHAMTGDDFTFDFTEPVELTVLVEWVKQSLDMQVLFLDGGLAGQKIYFNTPVTVKRKDVLPFLTMLLEQREYTLYQDSSGIYIVQPKGQYGAQPLSNSAWSTTRIIHTPNIKPSALQANITALLAGGRAGQGGQAVGGQPIYMDDLGLIIISDTPRMISIVEDFINRIVEERAALQYFRFELVNISAAAAKDRVLELLGQQTQQTSSRPGGIGGNPAAAAAAAGGVGGAGGSITNLGDRMTIDPTSNTLFLRGREDERVLLTSLLVVVDVPNTMDSRWYPVGYKTAVAVATQGKAEQLGSINEFDFESAGSGRGGSGGGAGGAGLRGTTPGAAGSQNSADNIGTGAGFVLYPEAGGFIFRGTDAQHKRVEALVTALKVISAGDPITYEFYKLKHGKSTEVAEIIQNLISNTAGTGNRSGSLLGAGLGGASRRPTTGSSRPASGASTAPKPAGDASAASSAAAAGTLGEIDGADVFVLADEPNNQVLVKAPAKLQHQFRTLIGKIDLRRPQVYIDAKIVVVSATDDFRLAIEAQQIIGQFAFNTNFGLGSLTTSSTSGTTTTTTGGITSRKNVATDLAGFTSALVRSKDVPLIVTAMAKNIDTRIVATPQLLVDDNEEAEISSLDQQPTGTTSQSSSAGSTVTGFQGFESAGPKLKVKPQISEGGYMRLEYSIELSSFNGAASGNLPPPKLENKIESKSVTVPTDATIVVGGLTFTQTGNTVIKVPLLGDIPLVGHLFRDDSKSERTSTLYVFITPKIMRDPSFADLRLLTKAPLASVGLDSEYPPASPEAIPVVDIARFDEDRRRKEEAVKHKVPEAPSPAKGTPIRKDKPASDEPH